MIIDTLKSLLAPLHHVQEKKPSLRFVLTLSLIVHWSSAIILQGSVFTFHIV